MGDQVRCFHCDGGLRHWNPDDDPWTEHARWFPRCSFVNLVKGQEFVTACAIDSVNTDESSVSSVKFTDRILLQIIISCPIPSKDKLYFNSIKF